jgi:hypothetical protein
VKRPDAIDLLRKTAFAGTKGFGELSGVNISIDGPEMRRVYELAAEMQMAVITHYQDYSYADAPLQPAVGFTRPQFARLEGLLKAYPKTTFIGHGPSFWANIGADAPPELYPSGPVKRGGLSDRMLSEYPNLYAGVDATSAVNAFHRDPEFAKEFLVRHQDKLFFGSDCSCIDGHGTGKGATEAAVAENPLIKGKCLARVNLAQLQQLTSPALFRKITWENGTKFLKLPV